MGVGVFLVDVVGVVGADNLDVVVFGEAQEHFVDLILLGHVVALEFDVVVFTEDVVPPFELFPGGFFVFAQDGLGHHGADAAGGSDEALVVLQDEFLVDARVFAVKALHVTQRAEFDEVFVPLRVFGEEKLVVAFVAVFLGEGAPVTVGDHVKFAAHDRFYALVFGGFGHELEHPEHIAVVGDGQAFHAVGGGFFKKAGDGSGAVEQGVLGVAVEVGEIGHG